MLSLNNTNRQRNTQKSHFSKVVVARRKAFLPFMLLSLKKKKNQPKMDLGFPCGSAGKESTCNVGDLGSISELGRSPGERKGYPLQYSGLENSMDYSPLGHRESDTIERLSLSLVKCTGHAHHESPAKGSRV